VGILPPLLPGRREKPRTSHCGGPRYAGLTTPYPLLNQEGNKEVALHFFLGAGTVPDNVALSRKILPTRSNNRINTY